MRGHLGSNRFSWVATPSTHRPDGLVPGHLDGTFLWHYLTCVCGGNDIAGKVPDGTTTFTHLGVHRLGNSNRSPGRVVYLHPLGEVQTMVPSGSFLGYRLVKPGSPLVMAAYAPGEKTGLSANLRLSSSRKEACYARNKITNHHFTLGGGWRRVCGIRNDRRTRRRRPAGTQLARPVK